MMGERLKKILRKEGVSRPELCARAHIDKGHLSRILADKGGLSLAMCVRIGDALGYDLEWVKRRAGKGGAHGRRES
jgi:transcriptional regulator with XRE-family HTH domain